MNTTKVFCPKRVVYVYSDFEYLDKVYDYTLRKYTKMSNPVLPFTCCDIEKKSTIETAEKDFNGYRNPDKVPVQKSEYDNVPKAGYKIHSVGHHNNRDYYNIITPEGFYTEFHLDDALDVMKNEGIRDGEILSQLVWVRNRKTYLVRFGSEEHKEALENGKDK